MHRHRCVLDLALFGHQRHLERGNDSIEDAPAHLALGVHLTLLDSSLLPATLLRHVHVGFLTQPIPLLCALLSLRLLLLLLFLFPSFLSVVI